jgi:hypothetical protein
MEMVLNPVGKVAAAELLLRVENCITSRKGGAADLDFVKYCRSMLRLTSMPLGGKSTTRLQTILTSVGC